MSMTHGKYLYITGKTMKPPVRNKLKILFQKKILGIQQTIFRKIKTMTSSSHAHPKTSPICAKPVFLWCEKNG